VAERLDTGSCRYRARRERAGPEERESKCQMHKAVARESLVLSLYESLVPSLYEFEVERMLECPPMKRLQM
jgi:hypothetical protein